jgi:hypothetical protein
MGRAALRDKDLKGGPQTLGNTTANQVYKVQYKRGKGFSGKGSDSGYLKEDTDDTRARYAVSASNLARGIGMGDLIPDTQFANHTVTDRSGTQREIFGAVSREAKGEALTSPIYDTDVHDQFMSTISDGESDEEIAASAEFKGYKNVGGRWMGMSGNEVNDIDLSRGNTQKGLNDLQWFDALIGNADRHGGNILVDRETGKVSGIDNDLSFGLGNFAKSGNKVDDTFVNGRDDKFLGLPSLIDKKTAKTLLKLNEKKIRKLLSPKGMPDDQKLSEREIKQVLERLEVIQDHIRGLEKSGGVVSKWDQTTYQKQLDEDVASRATAWNKNPIGGSYIQRQAKYLEKAKDQSNPDFWRKGHRTEDVAPVQPTPQVAQTQAPTQPSPQPTKVQPPTQPTGWQRGQTGNAPQPRMRLGGSRGTAPVPGTTAQAPQPTTQPVPSTRPRSDSRTGGLSLEERKKRLFAAMGQ